MTMKKTLSPVLSHQNKVTLGATQATLFDIHVRNVTNLVWL